MEKAYLVNVDFCVRVILDEKDVLNDDILVSKVKEQLLKRIDNDEILENIADEIREDRECPYIPMKHKQGESIKVKHPAFKSSFGDCNWVIDHIKPQLNGYPSLYVCYREDDERKTLFEFSEEEVE